MIGRRFVESAAYQAARAEGSFDLNGVEVLSERELRAQLHLRTVADLTPFDIEGVPYPGLAAAGEMEGGIAALVETIPVAHRILPLLGVEFSETELAGAADDGQPLPEPAANFGAAATKVKVPRFGAAQPVTLGVLDEPGLIASLLESRLRLGFGLGLGLENEMLNGNGFWPGLANLPTSATGDATHAIAVAKGGGYRNDAIGKAIAKVQDNGWYMGPINVISHPDTKEAAYDERDGAARPLGNPVMLDADDDEDDDDGEWLVSKYMPVGAALVGDFWDAVALFQHGGLEVSTARAHSDFLTRSMLSLKLETRLYMWPRQMGAIAIVTGL